MYWTTRLLVHIPQKGARKWCSKRKTHCTSANSTSTKCLFFLILLNVVSQLQDPSTQLHHNQHVITQTVMHMLTCEVQRMNGYGGRGGGRHMNSVYHCIISINVFVHPVCRTRYWTWCHTSAGKKELFCSPSELRSPVPLQLFSLQFPSVKMTLINLGSRWMLTRAGFVYILIKCSSCGLAHAIHICEEK